MRNGSIGAAGLVMALTPVLSSLSGCDIGQRTRVESLYDRGVPTSIAVDENTVYWTESSTFEDMISWTIKAVPKKALPPVAPAEPVQGPGKYMTVEAGTIWFADPAGTVSRRDPDPDPTVTQMFMPTDATAIGLVRDSVNLYELLSIGNPQTEWQLWSIPRDDSAPTMMASEVTDVWTPLDLTTDGIHVYVGLGGPVDEALVGEIRRVAVGTTDMETFAADIHRPQVLREFGENLFWYEVEEIQDTGLVKGRLQRSPKDGGPSRVLASITGNTSLAVDDQFVYWVDAGDGRVWVERIPQSRSTVLTSMVVLEPAGASIAIAVDEAYVYWSDQGAAELPTPKLNRMLKRQ